MNTIQKTNLAVIILAILAIIAAIRISKHDQRIENLELKINAIEKIVL